MNKKTISDFSNAMITLYEDYLNYDPIKIKKYCNSKFSEKVLSLKMIYNYKQILNN